MTLSRTDLASVLEKTALLSNLSREELQILATRTVRKLFSTGELLFSEGEPCNGLHIIAKGKIRIFKTSVNGREQVLAVNVPGESVANYPSSTGDLSRLQRWRLKIRRLRSSRGATFMRTALSTPKWRSRCSQ